MSTDNSQRVRHVCWAAVDILKEQNVMKDSVRHIKQFKNKYYDLIPQKKITGVRAGNGSVIFVTKNNLLFIIHIKN